MSGSYLRLPKCCFIVFVYSIRVVQILWNLFLCTTWLLHEMCLSLQEGVKTENDHINLKVAGQDGSVVQFKIKRHTPLSKLMKAYCERQVSLEPCLILLSVC